MITDRISLNLAYIYLSQVEETIGTLTDIELTKTPFNNNTTKGLQRFQSVAALKKYVQTDAPLIPFDQLDCNPLNLYEVKSFNVIINNATKNFVYNDNRVFKTKSDNVNSTATEIMNKSYMPYFLEVLKRFNDIVLDEYILLQYTYIDCGYIYTFFIEDYEKLQELYKKYKRL